MKHIKTCLIFHLSWKLMKGLTLMSFTSPWPWRNQDPRASEKHWRKLRKTNGKNFSMSIVTQWPKRSTCKKSKWRCRKVADSSNSQNNWLKISRWRNSLTYLAITKTPRNLFQWTKEISISSNSFWLIIMSDCPNPALTRSSLCRRCHSLFTGSWRRRVACQVCKSPKWTRKGEDSSSSLVSLN